MKLVTTPPRGAKHVRTYGPLDGIARIEDDAALVAAVGRIPVIVQGKQFALYVERTEAELEAELLVENDPGRDIQRIEITPLGRAALRDGKHAYIDAAHCQRCAEEATEAAAQRTQ